MLLHQCLELSGQGLQVLGAQIRIGLAAFAVFDFVELFVEYPADALSHGGFEPFCLFHHHIGVHHDQTPVGIPDEAWIVCLGYDARDGHCGETDVEDRIHHAGHGGAGAGAAGEQEGIFCIAVSHAHDRFGLLQRGDNLAGQCIGGLKPAGVIGGAAFGADREAGRYGDPQGAHFGEVGALAAQEVFVACRAFCSASAKGIHILSHRYFSLSVVIKI